MYRGAAEYSGTIATNQALRQILFSVMLYVPFGVIVAALCRKAWLTVLLGLGLSVLGEVLQYWTGLGWADVDDVVSNAIGIVFGTFLLVRKYESRTLISFYLKRCINYESLICCNCG